MLLLYMPTEKLKVLINDALGYAKKFDGSEMKSRELINKVEAIVCYIDENHTSILMNNEDINTSRLSYNLLRNLVNKGKIKFLNPIDASDFDEEIERLDDRIETQELAVSINETLSDTLGLTNV